MYFYFQFQQNCQRILRLPNLSRVDPAILAKEVVEKCDIIHKSQLAEVQQIIYYLQKRSESGKWNNSNSIEFGLI